MRILKELGDINRSLSSQGSDLSTLSSNFNNFSISTEQQFIALDKKVEGNFESLDSRLASLEGKDMVDDSVEGGPAPPPMGRSQLCSCLLECPARWVLCPLSPAARSLD
jgi:hypothetical protein